MTRRHAGSGPSVGFAPLSILVVHHDADQYGADKSLLAMLHAFAANGFAPIVLVPYHGPLVDILRGSGIEVHVGPVAKVSRTLASPVNWIRLAAELFSSIRFISHVVAGRKVALVYSNSLATLGGSVWGLLRGVPRIRHVREIIVTPKIARHGFPRLVKIMGSWVVCNSNATRQWLVGEVPMLASRSVVIWNGLEEVARPEARVSQESDSYRRWRLRARHDPARPASSDRCWPDSPHRSAAHRSSRV